MQGSSQLMKNSFPNVGDIINVTRGHIVVTKLRNRKLGAQNKCPKLACPNLHHISKSSTNTQTLHILYVGTVEIT